MQGKLVAWALICGVAASGCGDRDDGEAPVSEASPEIPKTAWWKNEGDQKPAAQADAFAAPMLAGWQSLPPVDAKVAQQGQDVFNSKGCVSCHAFGKGQVVGPDLQGITRRAEPEWVKRFVANPEAMLKSDPRAKELLARYAVPMPNLNLTPAQIDSLVVFFQQRDEQASRQGS